MSLFKFHNTVEQVDKATVLKSIDASRAVNFREYAEIKEAISCLEPNAHIYFYSDSRWSSYQLLNHLLDLTGPADVWLTTYGISESAMRQITHRKQVNHINNLYFVFSDEVKRKKPAEIQIAISIATAYTMYPCHAKIIAIRNPTHHVLVLSSMNLNRNNKLEAGSLTTHPETVNSFITQLNKILCI